jgi:hypothetical protein
MPLESCRHCGYALSVLDHRCRHCAWALPADHTVRFDVKYRPQIVMVLVALALLVYFIVRQWFQLR